MVFDPRIVDEPTLYTWSSDRLQYVPRQSRWTILIDKMGFLLQVDLLLTPLEQLNTVRVAQPWATTEWFVSVKTGRVLERATGRAGISDRCRRARSVNGTALLYPALHETQVLLFR